MYEVEIELIILGADHSNGSVLILSDNTSKVEIPRTVLKVGDKLQDVAHSMFRERCKISTTWAGINQVDTVKRDDKIVIQYGCIVPLETIFLKGAFTSINEIEDQMILDALIKVSVGL